jgi:hypothetical protein
MHLLKQNEPTISTDDGMHIDSSDGQPKNAPLSIRVRQEFASNATDSRELQTSKQVAPSIVAVAGMQIALSLKHSQNAFCSIWVNLAFSSKVISVKLLQDLKQYEQGTSI